MNITFEKVNFNHKDTIFQWLSEPHIQEFWDNSSAHKDDILNFINGRKTPSNYWNGIFDYWIGFVDMAPFSFIMTHEELNSANTPEHIKPYISNSYRTFGLDFCIGNKEYIGKGLASTTLKEFMKFFCLNVESNIGAFLIDPSVNNPRAIRVYQKAGFKSKGEFVQDGGYFDQSTGLLMVRNMNGIDANPIEQK